MFDFKNFFRHYGIFYITEGRNVADGNINIKCPFCGPADPSEHMGINLEDGAWGCWRNQTHRGRKPGRLIQAILGCTWDEVNQIIEGGTKTKSTSVEVLLEQIKVEQKPEETKKPRLVKFDPSFRDIHPSGFGARFYNYLVHKRKFREQDISVLCNQYCLKRSLAGRWKYRIIFPFFLEGNLVGWQGRSIVDSRHRYLAYPNDSTAKQVVYNYDEAAQGGRFLVIVEGPFDCLKLDFYGQKAGIRAVALLGLSVVPAQLNLLLKLSQRFDSVIILPDSGALAEGLGIARLIPGASAQVISLPPDVGDPADFSPTAVIPWLLRKLEGLL